ncbi:MAG: NADH-quinone oxidoreductase subunit N, partial [candidate division KSB1 bacterium]|nr:NADH-quinone oxidoreductase subunit N [candidate division KSB1 bacterium]
MMNPPGISFRDFSLFAPELTLIGLGLMVLVLGLLFPRMYRETLVTIVLTGLAAAFIITVHHWNEPTQVFSNMLSVDNFSVGFNCLFLMSAALAILLSLNALEGQYLLYSEYVALLIFATVGMMLMASSSHLLTLFLGL